MFRVILAEWRKLRRPTLLFGTLGTVSGLSALFGSLLFLLIDSPQGNSRRGESVTREILSTSTGVTLSFSNIASLLGIVALCVFAAQTAQEYTYGTLRNLLVRQPSRMKILGGKFISMSLFASVMVLLSGIVCISVSVAFSGRAKVSTDLWFTSDGQLAIARTFFNVLISVIGFGTFGMILGLIFRSPISAISIGVLWNLIIENLLSLVVKSSQQWFPGIQFSTIAQGGSPDVTYSHALLVGGLYTLVGAVFASLLFKRRDVSN